MSIERLKSIKEQLMSCVESQMHNLKDVDAEELGEAVDMVKDMEEAIYYCTIVEAMKESEKKPSETQPVNNTYYYGGGYPIYYGDESRMMDRRNGQMYYDGNQGTMQPNTGSRTYTDWYDHGPEVSQMRDSREGRSPMYRKMYMEGQEKQKSKDSQMKELEKYMQELSTDITEMIAKASPEEKAILRQKMTNLANKIA